MATDGGEQAIHPSPNTCPDRACQRPVLSIEKLGSLPVALALLLAYCLSTVLPRWFPGDASLYVGQPLGWCAVAALVLALWRRESGSVRLPVNERMLSYGLLAGFVQIVLAVLLGILMGFGRSPYDHRPDRLILNLWYAGAPLAGQELARWYLILRLGRQHPYLGFGVAWLFCFLLALPPLVVSQLGGLREAVPFAGRVLMPEAAEGLLATYLAMAGGPLPSILYRGLLLAFEWVAPVLPNLSWPVAALAGTAVPVLALVAIETRLTPAQPQVQAARGTARAQWIVLAFIALIAVWFTNGVFGFRPALISGVSMLPLMRTGDIAVTRQVAPVEVEVGDIIRYKLGNAAVLHRVLEKGSEGGRIYFVTKGDNNHALDAPVDVGQVEGKLVLIVRKLGWVSIWLSRLMPGDQPR